MVQQTEQKLKNCMVVCRRDDLMSVSGCKWEGYFVRAGNIRRALLGKFN